MPAAYLHIPSTTALLIAIVQHKGVTSQLCCINLSHKVVKILFVKLTDTFPISQSNRSNC